MSSGVGGYEIFSKIMGWRLAGLLVEQLGGVIN